MSLHIEDGKMELNCLARVHSDHPATVGIMGVVTRVT